jgi:leader peptidase (prepilin peptidase)/N-methyltransferase
VSIAAVIDRRCGAIFDRLTCTLALVALLVASATGTIVDALCGAGMTGGALAALFFCTQRRGIGLGDVKLAAGIGAGLGGVSGLVALGVAFVIGGAYGSWLLGTRRATRGTRIRFGPFVAAGTYIAVLVPVHAR